MKITLGLFILLLQTLALASTPVATVIDYLKETPAAVSGNISIDTPLQVYSGSKMMIPIGMNVRAKKGIGFSFSEQHLQINTDDAIALTIGGIPFRVKEIYYHAQTGRFKVRTDTPLNIGEKSLNEAIEKQLNDHYRPKVLKAFQELKSLRSAKRLNEVNKVIQSIKQIFATGTGNTPTVRGSIDLQFYPPANRRLKIHQWNADIQKGDAISFGMDFVQPSNGYMRVSGVDFRSSKGIRFSGKTSVPEIASVNFRHMRADGNGINFNYDIGAEEVISGFILLIGAVKAASGHPGDLMRECDPVKLQSIRRTIDGNLRNEIAQMIRVHRQHLLAAGASRELLAALD